MMNNRVQNFGAATGPLFKEIEEALLARPIDVNGLLQKMDMLRKTHLLLTVNAATLREQYNIKDNKEYVNKTVQVISNILFQTNPAFTSENSLQHLRNMVLDHIYFIGTHQLSVLDEEAVIRSFFNAFVRLYEILLDELRQDPLLRVFIQILLLNSSSGELIAVFLDFVLKQLEDFDNKEKSPALFSVLHDVVVSLMKFDAKEEILEIYLLPMIEKCMELAPAAKEPCNFLKVIHLLFLAVKADDTETDIGRSLLSSLPSFIQILHFWYKISTNPDFSNLALQVSITILSSCDSRLLIPNLSLVLMLVVEALNKNVPELTINALKILQSFENIDKSLVNIKMAFSELELANGLHHTLSSGMDGVVECAFRLLNKYHSSQHNSSQFKYEALTFTPAVNISFKNGYTVSLPLDKLIKSAFHIAHPKPANCLLLKECLKIMKYYVSSVFNEDCSDLLNQILSSNLSLNLSNQRLSQKSISDFDAIKPLDSHRFVLMGILAIASYNCDIDEIGMFFEQCMMHCTVHCLHGAIYPVSKDKGIDGFIIVDAIGSFLSFCSGSDIELIACIEKSLKALEIFVEISETVIGMKIWEFSLFEQIWKKVCLLCYEKAWHTQSFACKAMQLFINKCPTDWKCNHLAEFIMHLLHVMKISSLENLLENSVCTLAGTILEDNFSAIKENLKDILNPVLEISVTCMFSTCEAVRNQGNRLFKFLREISSEQIELMLPDLPRIKLMLNDLSRIDKCLESVPLKSKVGILDGFLFFLDVWPKLLGMSFAHI
ncbi:hypothetical protein AVEN_195830-1 [Araneus ventricosus]|uniref:Uncharacterized protein n=1 Tax=Araneus ventricosus TaxID=182803 RepID=A0A4Y2F1Q6_ARAVE|nr:hypothetical protein AVEN_195830-1 [Araneus ventricosus]